MLWNHWKKKNINKNYWNLKRVERVLMSEWLLSQNIPLFFITFLLFQVFFFFFPPFSLVFFKNVCGGLYFAIKAAIDRGANTVICELWFLCVYNNLTSADQRKNTIRKEKPFFPFFFPKWTWWITLFPSSCSGIWNACVMNCYSQRVLAIFSSKEWELGQTCLSPRFLSTY